MANKLILTILDGWGIGQIPSADAIRAAEPGFFKTLMKEYPHSTLVTHGVAVGLPEGQMGNSEVGHLNLGAGRIVYQELERINKSIREGTLAENQVLNQTLEYCNENSKPLHFIGLISDGGVHSHVKHLKALVEIACNKLTVPIYLHVITDGRDTDPHSALATVSDLESFIQHKNVSISTLIGRYYAMDRDKRWERIQKAFELMTDGVGENFASAEDAIRCSYDKNITDEFILPAKISPQREGLIQEGDAVFCFNFRTDRLRELTEVLTQRDLPEYEMKALNLHFVTMTAYDDSFRNVGIVFDKEKLKNTLGEVLSMYGLTQYRMAETEKYPHVSYFFSGGQEKVFFGEKRELVASPKVATYDLQPEMSAIPLTNALLRVIQEDKPDFICVNFANTDMVGHTGVFQAVVKAVQTVDECMSRFIPIALEAGYELIILADHGNADFMINADGSPNTAHSMNPVPCIYVSKTPSYQLKSGKLADIAPTILQLLQLPIPVEMDGESLLVQKN